MQMLDASVKCAASCNAKMLCFVLFAEDATSDHIVEAYSIFGLVTALYVESNVSCVCHTWSKRGTVLDALAAVL